MGVDQVEVLFIGGRSGVGKSTVAAEVCAQLEAAGIAHVQLEGDFLGQVFPPPPGDPDRSRIVLDNLAALWRNFAALGYRRLVYTNTVSVLYADGLAEALDAPVKIARVLLTASDAVANERLATRELGSGLDVHVARSARAAARLDRDAPADVVRIGTDGRSVVDIAADVVAATGWSALSSGDGLDREVVRPKRRMSFDGDASGYQRGRPPYPDAVFELLTGRCGLRPGARVLEIGAGTGLATGPLLAAGAHVTAVEPGGNLARVLTAVHGGDRLEVAVADFETAELPGGYDLAVAAMALHWLDPATSTEKIGGLVRPGGWLAAWWTEFGDRDRPTEFRDRLDEVYRDLLPAEPGYLQGRSHVLDTDRWRRQLSAGGWFGDVEVEVVSWQQTLTPATARDLWSTFPNIAELAPDDRESFLSRLAAIIDDLGGQVDDPRLTVVYTAARTGG
ncbi:methyltransferase [Catellatospora sp. NPDC049111]|uniref:methyltransferase n=1 Tax=Catellatospora sp. NPDC049111 TaxID=3155271 RepID=UPI0033F4451D